MDKETRRLRNLECKKREYQKRIKNGLCGLCGKPKVSKTMCQDCLNALKNRNKFYKESNPKKFKEQQTMYSKKWHREALEKISKDKGIEVKCKCGCSNVEFLEIDHINNDGSIEREKLSGQSFHLAIIKGKRKTDDLTILCKVCNFAKYCSMKIKKGDWKITFKECD